jgi:Raf kinase inhibitor-like YbhB/YbcL family protein
VAASHRWTWALCLLVLAGCSGGESASPARPHVPSVVRVSSSAFPPGGRIPTRYTCDGAETSPPLAWTGVPGKARALALVVDDPDAPGGTFVHWVLLDIPVGVTSLREGQAPSEAVQATNSAGRASYTGPCPPQGTHHYRFTVYALSAPTGLPAGASLDRAMQAVARRAVAQGRLVGTYRR